MHAKKRASRFANEPVLNREGRPILPVMTDRQLRLLSFLQRNRYATFDDIHAYLAGDPTALRRTIRVLKGKPTNYIKVCDQHAEERNLRRKVAYELDKNGVEYLRRNGAHIPDRSYARNFTHAALASHVTASIEAGIASAPNARLISWAEILSSKAMPETTKRLDYPTAMRVSYHVDGEVFEKSVRADSQPQRHRTYVLPLEGFPPRRGALRSKRHQLPRRRLHRRDRQLLLMSPDPRHGQGRRVRRDKERGQPREFRLALSVSIAPLSRS